MRPRLTTILLLLVLGAVVNVGVAWGCAAWIFVDPSLDDPGATLVGQIHTIEIVVQDRVGVTRVLSWGLQGPRVLTERPRVQSVPRWSLIEEVIAGFDEREDVSLVADGRGWPMLSLSCLLDFRAINQQRGRGETAWCIMLDAPHLESPVRALPLRPIAIGFAVNTLFYAAILWVFIGVVPIHARRLIRIRRGLCPKCAYPVGDAAVCTECGAKLKHHRAPTPASASTDLNG